MTDMGNEKRKQNRLLAIGWLGDFYVYLNISPEEALERYYRDMADYYQEYPGDGPTLEDIKVIEFDDCFMAYDIWEGYDEEGVTWSTKTTK